MMSQERGPINNNFICYIQIHLRGGRKVEILFLIGIAILVLGALLLILLTTLLVLMFKGIIRKHPKLDQTQEFIYRMHNREKK